MSNYNHTCKVCGKGYNACDTCLHEKNYLPWRAIACTQGHFQAYMVLFEYGNGTLKKADAREVLPGMDIDGWENYPEHNRVVIAEILKEEERPVEVAVVPLAAEKPLVVETPKPMMLVQPQENKQVSKIPYNNYSKFRK